MKRLITTIIVIVILATTANANDLLTALQQAEYGRVAYHGGTPRQVYYDQHGVVTYRTPSAWEVNPMPDQYKSIGQLQQEEYGRVAYHGGTPRQVYYDQHGVVTYRTPSPWERGSYGYSPVVMPINYGRLGHNYRRPSVQIYIGPFAIGIR